MKNEPIAFANFAQPEFTGGGGHVFSLRFVVTAAESMQIELDGYDLFRDEVLRAISEHRPDQSLDAQLASSHDETDVMHLKMVAIHDELIERRRNPSPNAFAQAEALDLLRRELDAVARQRSTLLDRRQELVNRKELETGAVFGAVQRRLEERCEALLAQFGASGAQTGFRWLREVLVCSQAQAIVKTGSEMIAEMMRKHQQTAAAEGATT